MIVSKRFCLDTNILIYGVDISGGKNHEIAKDLIRRAPIKDCYLTVQVLGEFFHAVTRKKIAPMDNAAMLLRTWKQVFPVEAANVETIEGAVEYVRDHRLQFWDAMLLTTARQIGCEYILSEDMQHGRRIGGVEVCNPFFPDSASIIERLLT